jgi:hypothetical protein
MKFPLNAFTDAIEALFRHPDAKAVTVFCNPLTKPTHRVRVCWRGRPSLKHRTEDIIISFGRLNYAERQFQKHGAWVKGAGRRIVCWTWPKHKKRS